MKIKDKSAIQKNLQSGAQTQALVILCFGIAALALSIWLYSVPVRVIDGIAAARLETSLNLAADNAVNTVSGLQSYLAFISRMPELKNTLYVDHYAEALNRTKVDFELLMDSFEQDLAHIYQRYLNAVDTFDNFVEMPVALYRRIQADLSGIDPDEMDDPPALKNSLSTTEQMHKQTAAVRNSLELGKAMFGKCLSRVIPVAQFFSQNFSAGKIVAQNSARIENLFAVALHEKKLQAMVLKDLDGNVIARYGGGVTEKIIADTRDCRAIKSGTSFFCGPVAYDSLAKMPVWWMALPIRNQNREAVSCLSAVVDVSFLSEIARQVYEHDAELVFVEGRGNIIGSAQESQVEQMVSMHAQLQRIRNWQNVPASYPKIRDHEGSYFLGGMEFSRDNLRHQPDWKIVGKVSARHLNGSRNYLFLLCVIVLAATGLYALSCSLMRLLNFSLSEDE